MTNELYEQKYIEKYIALEKNSDAWLLNEWRAEIVGQYLKEQMAKPFVLDVGCGSGTFLDCITRLYDSMCKPVGIDINELAVGYCVLKELKAYTPRQFNFLMDKYLSSANNTVMTFWDSLEHLTDPAKIINKYRPIRIFASLPCLDAFLQKNSMDDIVLWKHYRPKEHLWNFTAAQFVRYMKNLGYQLLSGPVFTESKWRVDKELGDGNIMTFQFTRA